MLKKTFIFFIFFLGLNILSFSNAQEKKIIAVLPFDVLSEKVEYKQFGLGTTDTLSAALTSIPNFTMIERNKLSLVMKEQGFQNSGFTNEAQSIKLGKLLGAEIIITGTIQTFEKQFRIVASFIDVESGKIIKATKVTGNDIFELQDKLASELIENEKLTLTEQKRQEISKITKSTQNIDSYSYYITGKTFYYNFANYVYKTFILRSVESKKIDQKEIFDNLKSSIQYFNKAIEADNNYSLAYASKSKSEASLVHFYFKEGKEIQDKEIKEIFENAKKDAQKSLELNPNLPEGYIAMSILSYYDKNYDKSIELSQKAVSLNPNDDEAVSWLSISYFSKGNVEQDIDKKIEAFSNSIKYNKYFTNSYKMLGYLYQKKEMLNEAEANFEKAYKINDNDLVNIDNLKKIYNKRAVEFFSKNMFIDAVNYYLKLAKIEPLDSEHYNNAGVNYYLSEQYKNAEEMYQKAINLNKNNSSYYYNLAILYEKIKDIEKSKENYKKACDLGINQACGK